MAKLTPNQQEYEKQKRRIERYVKELEKQGEIVDIERIKDWLDKPKTITHKYLTKLQRIEKSDIPLAPSIEYEILNNVYNKIETWEPLPTWGDYMTKIKLGHRNRLRRWLDGKVNKLGRITVAKNMQAEAERVNTIVDRILYDSGTGKTDKVKMEASITIDLAELETIITGEPISAEEAKSLSEEMELFNYWEWENE